MLRHPRGGYWLYMTVRNMRQFWPPFRSLENWYSLTPVCEKNMEMSYFDPLIRQNLAKCLVFYSPFRPFCNILNKRAGMSPSLSVPHPKPTRVPPPPPPPPPTPPPQPPNPPPNPPPPPPHPTPTPHTPPHPPHTPPHPPHPHTPHPTPTPTPPTPPPHPGQTRRQTNWDFQNMFTLTVRMGTVL